MDAMAEGDICHEERREAKKKTYLDSFFKLRGTGLLILIAIVSVCV